MQITEEIITYPPIMLENWKAGDKSIIPDGTVDTEQGWNQIHNQPSFMFGEYYTLWKKKQEGWNGFHYYLISTTCEPENEKYFTGKFKIEELIPLDELTKLRQATKAHGMGKDHGLPDLFLYNEKGEYQFLEIKKESDTVKDNQLLYLGLIHAILGCHVGIVYLAKEGSSHTPQVYDIEIPELP